MTSEREARIAAMLERLTAPLVFGLPLLYLLTSHSWSPAVFNYSTKLLGLIVLYLAFYVFVLGSYGWTTPTWLTRARRLVVLLGFWTMAGAVVAEAILRLVSDYPRHEMERLRGHVPDPEVGYVYAPNYRQRVVGIEWTTDWRTNSLGIRADRDYGPKPDSVFRIVGIGDSFTIGVGMPLEETWPALLEQRLNEDPRLPWAFEVVNAGHSGWGTVQQVAWMEREGARLDADVVLLAMTPNDIDDNRYDPPGHFTAIDGFLANRITASQGALSRMRFRERWYSLPGVIERSELLRRWRVFAPRGQGLPTGAAWDVDLDEEGRDLHERTKAYLLALHDVVVDQGARFGIVLVTFREQIGEMGPGYSPNVFGERWTTWGAGHDIPVVDMYPMVSELRDPRSLYFRWDNHYNTRGNQVLTDAAIALLERGLILDTQRARQDSNLGPPA